MPVDTTRGRAMAEAIMAPSAIVLAGAGASAAILAGAALPIAAVVGAVAWGARVWTRLPKVVGHDRIDVYELQEPWRHFMRDALHAHQRFTKVVSTTDEGPLRDRLTNVAGRIDDAVHECWAVAQRGQQLSRAVRDLEIEHIERELADVEAQFHAHPERDELGAACESLRAQLASASRVASVAQDAADKLTRINAELDEAVARAVEITVSPAGDLSPLDQDVENIVVELESLRQALDEASRPAA